MKIIIRLIIMLILMGLSSLVLGSGALLYLLSLSTSGLSGFLSILTSTVSGNPDLSGTITFLINFGIGIGILMGYYILAHLISKIFIRD